MTSDHKGEGLPQVDEGAGRPPSAGENGSCDTAAAWGRLPRFDRGNSDELAVVISRDILPALMVAFGAATRAVPDDEPLSFTARDRADFASGVLVMSSKALTSVAQGYVTQGFTVDQILLELLAPVARQLGILWERDEINFVDVTVAVQKIQHVLQSVCQNNPTPTAMDDRPLALLLPAPQENHTFGLLTMSELLRRRGWNVMGGLPTPLPEVIKLTKVTPFVMIGFSLSADDLVEATAAAIQRIRRHSRNKTVKVVIGGRVAGLKQNIASEIGADAAFADAADACKYADTLAAQYAGARS